MLELYFRPMACSLASRIALTEAGIEARYTEVDVTTKKLTESGADFLPLSALGQVPTLRLEDRSLLSENSAVLQYIADRAPNAKLAPPSGTAERYLLQQWLSFVGSEMHKSIVYLIFSPDSNEGALAFARKRAEKSLPVLAKHLAGTPHLLGESFTVADAYLIWALLLLRFSAFELDPAIQDYLGRMLARPAVRDSIALERRLSGR